METTEKRMMGQGVIERLDYLIELNERTVKALEIIAGDIIEEGEDFEDEENNENEYLPENQDKQDPIVSLEDED